jgi:hypothetical protein
VRARASHAQLWHCAAASGLLTHTPCFSPRRWNDHSKYVGITDATQINTIDYINNLGAGAHLMIATTFGCVHRCLFSQQAEHALTSALPQVYHICDRVHHGAHLWRTHQSRHAELK